MSDPIDWKEPARPKRDAVELQRGIIGDQRTFWELEAMQSDLSPEQRAALFEALVLERAGNALPPNSADQSQAEQQYRALFAGVQNRLADEWRESDRIAQAHVAEAENLKRKNGVMKSAALRKSRLAERDAKVCAAVASGRSYKDVGRDLTIFDKPTSGGRVRQIVATSGSSRLYSKRAEEACDEVIAGKPPVA